MDLYYDMFLSNYGLYANGEQNGGLCCNDNNMNMVKGLFDSVLNHFYNSIYNYKGNINL